MSATPEELSVSASRKCSVEMYSSPSAAISFSARWIVEMNDFDGRMSGSSSPLTLGSAATASRARGR